MNTFKRENNKVLWIAQIGIIIAILGMLQLTGLAFILIPPISITTMHIPVIIAGIILGPLGGSIAGGAFGIMSLINATLKATAPADIAFSPFLSGSPISSIIMTVGVRILLGLVAGLVFKFLARFVNNIMISASITAFVASLIHTFGVLSCLLLLFPDLNLTFKNILAVIISINFLVEAFSAVAFSIAFSKIIPIILRKK